MYELRCFRKKNIVIFVMKRFNACYDIPQKGKDREKVWEKLENFWLYP